MQCVLIIAVVHFLLARICLKVITAYVCVCIGVSLRKTCNQTITAPIALCLCASAYSVRFSMLIANLSVTRPTLVKRMRDTI